MPTEMTLAEVDEFLKRLAKTDPDILRWIKSVLQRAEQAEKELFHVRRLLRKYRGDSSKGIPRDAQSFIDAVATLLDPSPADNPEPYESYDEELEATARADEIALNTPSPADRKD